MPEFENFDYATQQTGDIVVSAFQEKLDDTDDNHALWGYCLRIENNSNQRIRLLQKDFCFTNDRGIRQYDMSFGFNGELPDLEPGETFEFEDTAYIEGKAAVLYGVCIASTTDGSEFKINLPLIQMNSLNTRSPFMNNVIH